MTIGERVKEIRLAQYRDNGKKKMSQEEFGERLRMSRYEITNIETNRVVPAESIIELICKTYNVNPKWLRDEQGPMFIPDEGTGIAAEIQSIMKGQSEFAISVMTTLAAMPSSFWDEWAKKLHEIMKENEGRE